MIGRIVCPLGIKNIQNDKIFRLAKIQRAFCVQDYSKLKVNHFSTLNINEYNEVLNALTFSGNLQATAKVIRIGHPVFTDMLLALAWNQISRHDFQKDQESLDTVIMPFTTAYIKKFNNNHGHAFGEVLTHVGNYGIRDEAFWSAAKEQLLKNNMNRYIPVSWIGYLINAMAKVGQADAQVL